jgi:hypothetical protein
MIVRSFLYTKVNKDGTLKKQRGAVGIQAGIRMSRNDCNDGYWITITSGLFNGEVAGMTVKFADEKEMNRFMKTHSMFIKSSKGVPINW